MVLVGYPILRLHVSRGLSAWPLARLRRVRCAGVGTPIGVPCALVALMRIGMKRVNRAPLLAMNIRSSATPQARAHGFPFPICMTRANPRHAPMARSARRTSSATTRSTSSSTAVVWTRAAPPRFRRRRAGSSWRPCAPSHLAGRRRSRSPVGCSIKWMKVAPAYVRRDRWGLVDSPSGDARLHQLSLTRSG